MDPTVRLVEWYNYERDHVSLGEGKTLEEAYASKMSRGYGHGRAVGHYL